MEVALYNGNKTVVNSTQDGHYLGAS